MSSALMIYGGNGYVGEHVARTAGSLGVKAIVAGRDAARLDRIASETGLEQRAFGLDDPAAIDSALSTVAVVLNCAGPFKYTAEPLVEACLRVGAHYLDITGEIPVYEAHQAKDADEQFRWAVSRLHGPEAGLVWTTITALKAAMERCLTRDRAICLRLARGRRKDLSPGVPLPDMFCS